MTRRKSIQIWFGIIAVSIALRFLPAQELDLMPVRIYRMGDWVSYKNCNYPTSMTVGREYVYFGSSGGVIPFNRYGYYWGEPYTTSSGLADDFISAIHYDLSTGYLWVAHRKGISYLVPTAQQWENISKANLQLPETLTIDRIGSDVNSIWLQGPGGYLFTVDKLLGFLQSFQNQIPESVQWSQSQYDPLPAFSDYLMDTHFQFFPQGKIQDQEFREFPITFFFTDNNLDIFGAAWGLGFLQGDANIKRLEVHSIGPLQNFINALTLVDDRIWMAGSLVDPNPIFSKNGISCLDLRQQTWNYYEPLYIHQLASDRINELAFRDNLLWIGTDQGLSIYNLRKDSWKRFSMTQGLSDEVVNSIAVTDTVAWIGTPLGLSSVSIPKFKITRFRFAPDNFLLRIHKVFATTENIWIGTDNGLYSIHRINKRVRHFDMFGNEVGLSEPVAANILSITGLDSTLFFVSEKTVLTYNPITKLWNLLPELSFLNTVNVYDLKTEGDNLWFATDKGAYLVRISDLYYEHYKICDGLAGERVFRIVIDDDWVWFATDQGLTKYAWRQYVQKFE